MTPEHDEELVRRYPDIFAQRHLTVQQSCMAWGFECGDGWFSIIDTLCRVVMDHATATGQPVPEAAQVKEKFGTLRVYWSGAADDFVTGATWMGEAMSERTCELTGRPGQLTKRGGWYQTLCEEKAVELGAVPVSTDRAPLSAAALAERYAEILRGPIDVPGSALPVVDAMLSQLVEVGKREPVAVTAITVIDGHLQVVVDGGGQQVAGMVAFAQAI